MTKPLNAPWTCKHYGILWTHIGLLAVLLVCGSIFGSMQLSYRKMTCTGWTNGGPGSVDMVDETNGEKYSAGMTAQVIRPTFPRDCWFNADTATFNDPDLVLHIFFGLFLTAYAALWFYTCRTFELKKSIADAFKDKDFLCGYLVWILIIFGLILLVGGAIVGARYVNVLDDKTTCVKIKIHKYSYSYDDDWSCDVNDSKGQHMPDERKPYRIELATVIPKAVPAQCWIIDGGVTFNDPTVVMYWFFGVWGVLFAISMSIWLVAYKRLPMETNAKTVDDCCA
jgi:hypothetical protein